MPTLLISFNCLAVSHGHPYQQLVHMTKVCKVSVCKPRGWTSVFTPEVTSNTLSCLPLCAEATRQVWNSLSRVLQLIFANKSAYNRKHQTEQGLRGDITSLLLTPSHCGMLLCWILFLVHVIAMLLPVLFSACFLRPFVSVSVDSGCHSLQSSLETKRG